MNKLFTICLSFAIAGLMASCNSKTTNQINLSDATILISPEIKSPVKESAGAILTEEIGKRTNLQLNLAANWGLILIN